MVTKTTELSAVNEMLSAIGEAPVSSLTGSVTSTVAIARNILANESRKLQVKGWHFNTDTNYPLVPDGDGYIMIPEAIVKVDLPVHYYGHKYDPVQRQGKLYDRKNHTYIWDETLKAEVMWLFEFDELPEVYRQYIAIRASRIFIDRILGTDNAVIYTEDDERRAWAACREYEADQADYNIFDNIDLGPTILR